MFEASFPREEFLDRLVQSSIDGILAFDRACCFTVWNPAMERLTGVPAREVLGRSALEGFPFLGQIGEDYYFQEALAGREAIARDRPFAIRGMGRQGFYESSFAPVYDRAGMVIGGLAVIRDVTERRRTEDRLRLSELRLQEAQALAHIGSWEWYIAEDTMIWSAELYRIYGLDPATSEISYALYQERQHPDDLPFVVETIEQALKNGQPFAYEHRIIRPNGAVRWVHVRGQVVHDVAGKPIRIFGTSTDITEQRRASDERAQRIRAEAAQAEAEAARRRLALLVEASKLLSTSMDDEDAALAQLATLLTPGMADWCIITMLGANQTAPASEAHPDPSIDAWTHAVHTIAASLVADDEILQVLGKGQSILIPAGSDALPATLSSGHHLRALAEANLGSAIIAPLTARGRMLGTMVLLTASGHYQTAAEQALAEELAQRAALSVDNARLYREAQRELAERRKIEAELREQTEVVETINRIGATLSAELDLQRLVQAVTDAATEVSGAQFGAFFFNQTGDDGERMTLYTLSGVPREAFAHYPLPRNTALFGPTFRGEGVIRIDDVLVDPRYGQNPPHHGMPPGHVPVRSYLAVPVISRSGEVLGGLFFGHAQPRIFTERVEQVVVGLAAQTAIAMDNARLFLESQQAIQARDHFLSMAAHELKTPVTAILGYAQLLAQRAERSGEADPRQARRLQTLLGQVVRMERLVHGLLDLSRLHLSVFTLDRAPVDLGALIKQLVEMLRSTLNRHTIDVRLDTGSHVVDGDEVRLEQVFQNILQNAIKYSPEGGPIDITVEHRGGDVCVTIRDRGIGIPASALPEIFKRFYRAGNAAAGHMAGMGVGLYVVHEIVTLHGGRIEVESEEGHGSCFRVFLLAAGTGSTT